MQPDTPFRILVLGNFSERSRLGCKPVAVDRDNFDAVMAKIGRAGFECLDDLHPDQIFKNRPEFKKLRDLRAKLADPATFRQVAAELKLSAAPQPQAPAPAAPPSIPASGLLDRVLDEADAGGAAPTRRRDEFADFIAKVVAPHLVAREDPRQSEVLARVDVAIEDLMRRMLHDPDFQSFEAAWRSLFFLVQRVETGPDLKIYAVDVAKEDIAGNAAALHSIIVDSAKTPRALPWSVVVANYTFATAGRDLSPLNYFGSMAKEADVPFLAEAELPSSGESEQWAELRRAPHAAWIGLAMPRFLLRLPYGSKTSPVESFGFEEMPERPEHHRYLWGNPAMACACLLGQAFNRDGWDMRPGSVRQLSGLPLHVYNLDGETHAQPCAELLMTQDEAEMLLDQGFMPLVSLKDQDTVRLLRFQSIAEPLESLAGPWN